MRSPTANIDEIDAKTTFVTSIRGMIAVGVSRIGVRVQRAVEPAEFRVFECYYAKRWTGADRHTAVGHGGQGYRMRRREFMAGTTAALSAARGARARQATMPL